MIPLGLGVLFLGYSATYYGMSQLRGQNFGFLDLVLPGRWMRMTTGQPPQNDDGTTPGAAITPGGAGPATTDARPSAAVPAPAASGTQTA